MANEMKHTSVGTSMTQAEFEAIGLHVCNNQATGDLIYASSATQLSRLGVGTNGDFLTLTAGAPAWTSNKATTLYIGDTANAKMTLGLTINQSTNTNESFAIKNTGVSHSRTSLAEADTIFSINPTTAYGGAVMRSFVETGNAIPIQLLAFTLDNPDTTKSTAGRAAIEIAAFQYSGDAETNMVADGNLVAIRTYQGAGYKSVAIFDEDGDLWLNGGITVGATSVGLASFNGAVTNLTVVNGIVTAAS